MENLIQIVPAVLTDNRAELDKMLAVSATFTDFVQIDIMDGLFVPSQSITFKDIIDTKTKLKWEAHLMVNNPETYIADFAEAGAEQIIFHYESTNLHSKIIDMIHNAGLKAGIAINPDTSIEAIEPLTDKLDSVLFMSVIPGFYGSKFIPEVLNKIREFCQKYPNVSASIDGGIKEDNIKTVASTGVSSICVGSAVFRQEDPAASFKHLVNICNS
ncbi:MAG: ribulose-phosphate 3-epimerase [Dehalococcoidales bacterium]